jgi:predicted phage terminase large subunit-like protein
LTALAETQAERDDAARRMNLPIGTPDPLGRAPGAALCPIRFSASALESLRVDVGSLAWQAEYMNAPRAPEGNRFKRAWFEIVEAMPAQIKKRVRYWDKAASADRGCFTVGLLMAATEDGHYIVEDVVRGQWSSGERDNVMRQTAQMDAAKYANAVQVVVEQEPGSSGVDAMAAIIKLLAGFPILGDRPTGDKDVRLEPFAAQAEAGNVRLLRGAWNGAYIDEMCAIPNGKYRDQGDATSGAFNHLRNVGVPMKSVATDSEQQSNKWTIAERKRGEPGSDENEGGSRWRIES